MQLSSAPLRLSGSSEDRSRLRLGTSVCVRAYRTPSLAARSLRWIGMTNDKCSFPCGEHPEALPAGEFARQSDGAVVATRDEAVVRANGMAP